MKSRWRVWIAFSALCVTGGSAWIVGQFWPSPLGQLPRLAFDDAIAAAALGVAHLVRRPRTARRRRGGRFAIEIMWSVILLALPTLVAAGARGHVEQFTSALVYTLVPAVVIVVAGQRAAGFGVQESPLAPVLPAVAGAGGAALLLPFVQPSAVVGWLWLGAVVMSAILSAVAAVELHRRLDASAAVYGAAVFALACAVVAGVAAGPGLAEIAALRGWDLALEMGAALLIDAPLLLLTVWLLPRVAPVAFAARYLAVPLVTIGEGLMLLRPEVTWTTPVAMAAMTFACWRLVTSARDRGREALAATERS